MTELSKMDKFDIWLGRFFITLLMAIGVWFLIQSPDIAIWFRIGGIFLFVEVAVVLWIRLGDPPSNRLF